MRNKFLGIAYAMLLASFVFSCSVVPLTGRHQLNLVSDAEILQSSGVQYHQFLRQSQLVPSNTKASAQVTRVGKRIAAATERYLKSNGLSEEAAKLRWEFNVVNSNQINAFCMPGGKIVVFTGLLRLVGSDDELATVMSHEVSHAIAKHSNERISQEMLRQFGGQLLGAALSTKSQALQATVGQLYGIGSQVAISLPFNRKQEYEADEMGLIFMAMAGYNPNAALDFWRKMAAKSGGNGSDFFSTHPSDQNRIAALQKQMPKAMQYYRQSR